MSFSSPAEKVRRSLDSGAAVSPHRIYRADPRPRRKRERTYQYVNESPTGTTTIARSLARSLCIYRCYISEDRYLACRHATFFRSPTSFAFSRRMQPPMNRALPRDIPITNSTPIGAPPCLPVSGTYVSSPPRKCVYWLMSLRVYYSQEDRSKF